ncbi:hypothetical protein HW130_25465 [Streptomyces sp. PKU-EA00015]|uniref:hypothetical protein n=1 Tax=Streptomyces sp. PKU-EA00015 TaxID=2748326 RepID=UPI00159FF7C1|nr:hypothetical protein [Streptomyces sp. PKU-EA00015]NWF29561.1 hypothetical protein [Streptomyces sp. PKU-EA00015]
MQDENIRRRGADEAKHDDRHHDLADHDDRSCDQGTCDGQACDTFMKFCWAGRSADPAALDQRFAVRDRHQGLVLAAGAGAGAAVGSAGGATGGSG